MKQADRLLLDGLRSTVLADIPQSHWEEVEKAVEDAGDVREVSGYARTIVFDAIEVAKASFATRSEAGRYAANMRWKGQGKTTTPAGDDGKDQNTGVSGRQIDVRRMKSDDRERLNELTGVARGKWIDEVLDTYPNQEKGGAGNYVQNLIAQAKRDSDGKSSDKKPFLDLTDIDSKGNLESGSSKPASVKPAKTSEVKPETVTRIKEGNLSDISRVIRRDLKAQNKKVPFGAEPYLEALDSMDDIGDMYGADRGSSIVAYALSNLSSYKGPVAREVKAELNRRLKAKK